MDNEEVTSDKLARLLAEHFGVAWGALQPLERDRWREEAAQLLDYLDQTALADMAGRMARRDHLLLR